MSDNKLAMIRKTGSTATTMRHENSNHLACIVVLIKMLKPTEADYHTILCDNTEQLEQQTHSEQNSAMGY